MIKLDLDTVDLSKINDMLESAPHMILTVFSFLYKGWKLSIEGMVIIMLKDVSTDEWNIINEKIVENCPNKVKEIFKILIRDGYAEKIE